MVPEIDHLVFVALDLFKIFDPFIPRAYGPYFARDLHATYVLKAIFFWAGSMALNCMQIAAITLINFRAESSIEYIRLAANRYE